MLGVTASSWLAILGLHIDLVFPCVSAQVPDALKSLPCAEPCRKTVISRPLGPPKVYPSRHITLHQACGALIARNQYPHQFAELRV